MRYMFIKVRFYQITNVVPMRFVAHQIMGKVAESYQM